MTPNGFPRPPAIDWSMLWPIVIVITAGVVALIIEMFRKNRSNTGIIWTSLLGLGAAAYFVASQFSMPDGATFANMIVRDRVTLILQLLLIGICAISFLFSEQYLREKGIAYAEFYQLALWATAGGMIMVSTTNLLILFLGLEILSIALYVLAGMSRREARSEESAIKYFLLGAFATGFLLYGIAFIYGGTGGLDLGQIGKAWASDDPMVRNLLLFGSGLILIGLCFKAALVPFHQWTPDVYQGAPTNVTAFMAAGSKVAAIGALYRVLEGLASMRDFWMPALFGIAIATMILGNVVACVQRDVKRTLGYSSIGNAGYLVVALLAHFKAPDKVSLGATLVFLIAYSVMTLGTFAVVSLSTSQGKEGTRFSDLYGLSQRSPFAAALLVVFAASLIGVPPTAGFFGKLMIFQDSLRAGLLPLAIVLALSSIISVYYYLGLVKAAYTPAEDAMIPGPTRQPNFGLIAATVVCAAAVLAGSMFAEPVIESVQPSGETIQVHSAPDAVASNPASLR
ncbi:MAG TPA: NADH-quinone oxidoreductase subunit N [Fimbriimonadaceae bacterium]|nr:NADH-quinone oxidoreductase subunit N [Fimbriimonadaceae bacterium]